MEEKPQKGNKAPKGKGLEPFLDRMMKIEKRVEKDLINRNPMNPIPSAVIKRRHIFISQKRQRDQNTPNMPPVSRE